MSKTGSTGSTRFEWGHGLKSGRNICTPLKLNFEYVILVHFQILLIQVNENVCFSVKNFLMQGYYKTSKSDEVFTPIEGF